ncbi:MAG: DUF1549 domain-containing protein, partial [Planctomycetales bacterium]|nr:DUF1549 domain-containing protein [Planctomycetales bacterium]
ELGLPWPEGESSASVPLSADERYRQERETLWSLQPVVRHQPPAVQDAAWPKTPIDHFVLARLEAAGLRPSPEVDRRTWIRRATFDLHGLPPTAEEVAAFENDGAADAYERVVDRLLASPRYGERWGRYWLDVARYADTKGYAFGKERKFPFAYTYRDWVIQAFNADMPYDQFIIKQLAADRLPDAQPADHAALGFLTVGRQYDNQPDNIDDQIDATARGLLGLTVGCARCHDHKYDAIPTEDYYSLYGVFASLERPKELPLIGAPEENAGYQKYEEELGKRQRAHDEYAQRVCDEFLDKSRRNVTEYLVRVDAEKPETLLSKLPFLSFGSDDVRPPLLSRWRAYLQQFAGKDHAVWAPLLEMRGVSREAFAEEFAKRMERWKGLPADQINPLLVQRLAQQPPTSHEELARTYGDLLADVYMAWKNSGASDEARNQLPPEKQALLDQLLADGAPTKMSHEEIEKLLPRAERDKLRSLQKNVDSHVANSPAAPPRAMSVVDGPHPYN